MYGSQIVETQKTENISIPSVSVEIQTDILDDNAYIKEIEFL